MDKMFPIISLLKNIYLYLKSEVEQYRNVNGLCIAGFTRPLIKP